MSKYHLSFQDSFLEEELRQFSWPEVAPKCYEETKSLLSEVYDFFEADPTSDLVLLDSHEEALAQVFQSHYHNHMFLSGKSHIITADCITSAQREILTQQKKLGVGVTFSPKTEKGHISIEELERSITPKTSLISITWAHPITGIIQPLSDIIKVCEKYNVALHVDLSGSLGQLDVSLKSLKIDYLTYYIPEAPKPIYPAGIISRNFMQLQPLIPGYGIQKMKGGLFDKGKLLNLTHVLHNLKESMYEQLLELPNVKKTFIRLFESQFPEGKILLKNIETLPSVAVFALPLLHAEYLLYALFCKNIRATFGGNKYPKLEHLLAFSPEDRNWSQSAIAFNIKNLNKKDVTKLIDLMVETVTPIQKVCQNIEECMS